MIWQYPFADQSHTECLILIQRNRVRLDVENLQHAGAKAGFWFVFSAPYDVNVSFRMSEIRHICVAKTGEPFLTNAYQIKTIKCKPFLKLGIAIA